MTIVDVLEVLTLLDLVKANLNTEALYGYASICEYFAFGYP